MTSGLNGTLRRGTYVRDEPIWNESVRLTHDVRRATGTEIYDWSDNGWPCDIGVDGLFGRPSSFTLYLKSEGRREMIVAIGEPLPFPSIGKDANSYNVLEQAHLFRQLHRDGSRHLECPSATLLLRVNRSRSSLSSSGKANEDGHVVPSVEMEGGFPSHSLSACGPPL
jgi:hypothetical protein